MQEPTDSPRKHHLLRLKLSLAAVLALVILGGMSWEAYSKYRYAEAKLPAISRMHVARADIVQLDEVLTMSARMAAASGNLDWEARYRQFEPQLDQAIKDALVLDPTAFQGTAASATGTANIALVDMERRAFELVRQQKKAEAQRLLSSGEYEAQKKIYASGMAEFNRHLLQASEGLRSDLLAGMRFSAIATIASAVLLILGALFVLRVARRWQAVMVESNRQLNQRTSELTELNQQLDNKVYARTNELRESAERSDSLPTTTA